jgi:hypothetical protein
LRQRKSVASRPKRNSSAKRTARSRAYGAQVDAGAQIIVAHELTQCGNDQGRLVPVEAIENSFGRKPDQDSGYCGESNLEALDAPTLKSVAGGKRSPP